MTEFDLHSYASSLAARFFVRGMEKEDVYQEAWMAAWLAPDGCKDRAARNRIYDLIKFSQRCHQPNFVEMQDQPVLDSSEKREELQRILSAPRTENEKQALGRRIGGIPIRREEKALGQAWHRLRERL